MLTAALLQLNGLIDQRPDLFYVRIEPNIAYAETYATSTENLPPPTIELLPALVPICTCESGQGTGEPQQFNISTGDVLQGRVNPDDTGECQINLHYHEKEADALSLDLTTQDGNIQFANWLYEKEGSAPWNPSRSCWRKG